MGHSVTLGGERVGSGSKSKVYLRNYERSTHDLSYDWLSTMGCGMLIPFMCELVTRDDKYEINLNAGLRTIPTKGPLFGSFKLQLDVYECPLRLYQALLHNNPLAIGLKANQVKFPKIRLYDGYTSEGTFESKSANNSLVKYLGISGIGTIINTGDTQQTPKRDFFGAGVLAYYDIFKNYYANKQEEKAYTLKNEKIETDYFSKIIYNNTDFWTANEGSKHVEWTQTITNNNIQLQITDNANVSKYTVHFNINYDNNLKEVLTKEDILNMIFKVGFRANPQSQTQYLQRELKDWIKDSGWYFDGLYNNGNSFDIQISNNYGPTSQLHLFSLEYNELLYETEDEVVLNSFSLKNIDEMRYNILSFHNLGQSFILDGYDDIIEPYYSAIGCEDEYFWKNPLAGICVKTYQSDIFNNWLNTEIIDGENGIAEITAISTSSGSITIDALQFSEKLYNLLNRIAVSGGTYQDYLDAAYTQSAKRFEESPIWVGGMSDEVIFEEIVQTAPAGDSQLGTLGGRGNLLGKKKGGKITVKIDEPSLLIGIVSITPRIVYTQGNRWFNTEIDSLQDIHVPALDAIGFQNLMGETMHFGSTIIEDGLLQDRPIIGKIPAWLHYMTNFDQAYGDFAATDGDGYMVLNRNYDCKDGILKDATTYIDPAKYNYAFAYTKREAQNFWVKIKCDIKARRLMSAKQIPTA